MITFRECGKMGQLGNQLFQIAAGLSLAKDNNDIFVHNWYCDFSKNNIASCFKNNIQSNPNYSKIEIEYRESPMVGPFNKIPYQPNMNLCGYFQSEKYFENNKKLISYHFEPADKVAHKIQHQYNKILDNNTCSIHIRRYNDYPILRMSNMNYFKKAINFIRSHNNKINFLIFSDDIKWCKEYFTRGSFIFIENNTNIEDLFLMSYCKYNIISNSSFSWWGSWLNKNPAKIVIAPRTWLPNPPNVFNPDIYRSDMIKI